MIFYKNNCWIFKNRRRRRVVKNRLLRQCKRPYARLFKCGSCETIAPAAVYYDGDDRRSTRTSARAR